MKKYIDLPEELLIGAYNILYHINDRPACVKANRVRKILAGEVTPGCSAATWREFFDFLDAKLAPAHPDAAQVIKKGAKVRKGDKVGKVTSTLMAKPGHALVEWGDGITHERKTELHPAHPGPLSPAEWAKRVRPEVTFSSEALTGMQDYAEYVAEYMRCRFSEAMDEEVKKYYMSRHAQNRIIEKTHTQ